MRTCSWCVRWLFVGLASSLLIACGGGGGNAGSSAATKTSTVVVSTPTVAVSSFVYQVDKVTLTNSGSDKVALTITALDTNNNPVTGATTTVAVDAGVYTPVVTVSDSSGILSGNITIGGNKANRTISAKITIDGKTSALSIAVTGSQLSLTPSPSTTNPGGAVKVDIKVLDVNGTGVPNTPVALSGSLGFSQAVTTDFSGNASATLASAPSTSGPYEIIATALGVTKRSTVTVLNPSGVQIPDAVIPTAASLAITPNNIPPNSDGSTTNRATLRAVFQDANNRAIPNVRVRFEIVPPDLGAGEQISVGAATVYSDASGVASTDYVSGLRSSPTNGVTVRACFGPTDASISAGACPNSRTATLTVASQPLSIQIGDNNLLTTGNNSLTYIKQFDVSVADAAGKAVQGAIISASVDITHYGKGQFAYVAPTVNADGTTSTFVYPQTRDLAPNITTSGLTTSTVPAPTTGRIWCVNEDTNRNGIIDTFPASEDVNGNGRLDPRKADVVLSFVGSNATTTAGRIAIQVEYPQSVATWIAYTVKVTTSVGGSEGTDQKSYVTSFLEADLKNGAFLRTPYGDQSCVSSK